MRYERGVAEWRGKGYPGVSGITRRLIDYWYNPEEFDERRFFFCQLEAAETLIWLLEAPEADKVGIEICSDGGAFKRRCAKMATGTGKNRCHGNGHCLADFEQSQLSKGHALF